MHGFLRRLSILLAVIALLGCQDSRKSRTETVDTRGGGAIKSTELADVRAAREGPLFELMTADSTGIDFAHRWTPPEEHEHEIHNSMAGGGVCVGDYDGDGLADVYLTRPFGGGRLYRNLGEFRFKDVTDESGITDDSVWGAGATFVDIDNDGDLDLYVCSYGGPNRLYLNQGDGTFKERAKAFGLDFSGASVMMAFADYDLDGDLDGYLITNRLSPSAEFEIDAEIRNGVPVIEKEYEELFRIITRPPNRKGLVKAGQYDHLYQNNGDGSFSDVSTQAGIRGNYFGLSATWWDYNDDGLPDLYVANDHYGQDFLYRNNGDGTFDDVIKATMPHTPWFSMGSDVADINNDGRFDLMGSDMSGSTHLKQKLGMGDMSVNGWFLTVPEPRQYMRNAVYLNTGTDRFIEVAQLMGVADTDWTWSIKFADLDNDGRVDLFVSNGMTRDWVNSDLKDREKQLSSWKEAYQQIWLSAPKRDEPNLAYRNLGDLHFESVRKEWGLDYVGVSFGTAMGDLDGDGDLDMIVNNFDGPAHVFRNHAAGAHRVRFRLKGTRSNRYGIGAMIRLEADDDVQVRYLTLSRGFMSANEPLVHFGLGQHEKIDRLTVRWPSGHEQILEHLDVDRLHTITEPDTTPPERSSPATEPTMFQRSKALAGVAHHEKPYDDFQRQPLLPNKMSQLGPGLAWGDADGDGDDDLFIGGAKRQMGQLYLNHGGGRFQTKGFAPWLNDLHYEDMAAVWLDADLDGDLDLYVVSGGAESEPGGALLEDRLYLNDGKANFTKAPEDMLPGTADSGSVAAACDFDLDGDLDLFVGGRFIPGNYPLTPNSRLLRNNGSRFEDVTEELAPQLRLTGMVSSATWSDADGDHWPDLLVTHEWGPVKLYHNDEGRLVDQTEKAGLAELSGWWNGIAARDLDGDRDIDYVVMNFGLNTKYHASPEKPTLLYYGDFDQTGNMRLIEAEYENDTLFPVRGKSCSSRAMPFLTDKFQTFESFGLADLQAIYTPKCLDDAHKFVATTLESGVLINDGSGQFTFRALPRLAQASPGFGVVLTEVDGDGKADLYMVQNFFGPQPETGRMDSGVSLLMKGNGDGSFTPVWPDRSGLVVPGDAKSLTATDLNDDGWPDFVVGVNDDRLVAFQRRPLGAADMMTVRLEGRTGNPTAVGACVTVHLTDGSTQTAEVQAGGGYLSQSSAILFFGLGSAGQVEQIEVVWPDGQESTTSPPSDAQSVRIAQPS